MCALEVVMALFTPNWLLILVENIWIVPKNLTVFKPLPVLHLKKNLIEIVCIYIHIYTYIHTYI